MEGRGLGSTRQPNVGKQVIDFFIISLLTRAMRFSVTVLGRKWELVGFCLRGGGRR